MSERTGQYWVAHVERHFVRQILPSYKGIGHWTVCEYNQITRILEMIGCVGIPTFPMLYFVTDLTHRRMSPSSTWSWFNTYHFSFEFFSGPPVGVYRLVFDSVPLPYTFVRYELALTRTVKHTKYWSSASDAMNTRCYLGLTMKTNCQKDWKSCCFRRR